MARDLDFVLTMFKVDADRTTSVRCSTTVNGVWNTVYSTEWILSESSLEGHVPPCTHMDFVMK